MFRGDHYLYDTASKKPARWQLSSYEFNEGIETIGDFAFYENRFMDGSTDKSVLRIFPSTLKTLGKFSFYTDGNTPRVIVFNGVLDLDAQLAQIIRPGAGYGVNGNYDYDKLDFVFCNTRPIQAIVFGDDGWKEIVETQDKRVFESGNRFLGATYNNASFSSFNDATTYGTDVNVNNEIIDLGLGSLTGNSSSYLFTWDGAKLIEGDGVAYNSKSVSFNGSNSPRYDVTKWYKVNADQSLTEITDTNKPTLYVRAKAASGTRTYGLYGSYSLNNSSKLYLKISTNTTLEVGNYRTTFYAALPFYKNHNQFINLAVTVNIGVTPKNVALTLDGKSEILEKTYDGNNSFNLPVSGTIGVNTDDILSGDRKNVSFDANSFKSGSIIASAVGTNVGEHIALSIGNTDIKLTGSKAHNYSIIGYANIKPATLTVNWASQDTFVYNGEVQAPSYTVSGFVNGESPTVDGYEMISYGISNPEGDDGKSGGDHVAQVQLLKGKDFDAHYQELLDAGKKPANPANYVGDSTKTYTITKVNASYTTDVSAISDLVYNGEAQSVVQGETSDGSIMCRIKGTSDEFVDIDSFKIKDAGSYTVEYYLKGDSSHNDIGSESETSTVNVSIAKLSIEDATVTLGDELYFDGTEQEQTISSIMVDTIEVPLSDVDVTNNKATTIGDYTLTVTAKSGSNFTGSTTKTFKMNKTSISPTVSLTGWTYGDTGNDPSVEGNTGGGTVTYEYKAKDSLDSTYTTTKPTNAGTYVVRATIGETTAYLGGSATYEFTIERKVITENPFSVSGTYTYDKTAQTPVLTGGSYVFGTDYDIVFDNSTDHTNAGEDIPFKVVFKGNYSGEFEMSFDIAKRGITVTPNENQCKTYGSDDSTLTYTITEGSLCSGDSLSGSLSRAEGENVGTYNINQGTLANDNYDITFVNNVTYTVNKKAITENPFSVSGTYTYDKTAQTPTLTGGSYVLGTDYDIVFDNSTDHTNAGENIPFKVVFKGNYSGEFEMSFDIAKRPITVKPNENQSKTFGSSDSALSYTITEGSLCSGDSLSGSLSRAEGENAGSYAITIGTLANDNYDITFVSGVEYEVSAKAITENPFTVSGTYTYDKTAQTPTLTGGSYLLGTDYDIVFDNSTDHTNAGEDIPFKVVFKGNYSGEFEMSFDIAKRSITVTPDANQSKVYGNDDATLVYTITEGSLCSGDSLSGSLSRAEGENVGTYNINQGTLANDNYDITFVNNVTYTVNKQVITENPFSVSGTYTYNKTAQTPTLTGGSYVLGTDYDVVFDNSTDHTNAGNNIPFKVVFKGNYSGEFDMTFSIAKCPITVTPNANQGKVVGEDEPTLTYSITSGTLYEGDTLSGTLSREEGTEIGTYLINQGSLANDNYEITFVNTISFSINEEPVKDDVYHYISIICFILLAVSAVLYGLNKIKKLIPLVVTAVSFVVGLVFMILSHACVVCTVVNILLMACAVGVALYVLLYKHEDKEDEDDSEPKQPNKVNAKTTKN